MKIKTLCTICVAGLHAAVMAQSWNSMAGGPAGRFGHALAYDTQRARTVMFGGNGTSTLLGDTWEWDGLSWTQVATTGPGQRRGHSMAFDTARGRVVLFGGDGGLNDTWEWNGSSWVLVSTGGPPPRAFAGMVYDSIRAKTVLFGGYGHPHLYLDDTWEWNGVAWTQVAAGGPLARGFQSMAYDSLRGKTVMFGGTQGFSGGDLGDTWEWDGTTWTQAATSGPAPRVTSTLAFDSVRHRCVLFGGSGGVGPTFTYHTDTWEWDGTTWTLESTRGPGIRNHSAACFDAQRARTILFGGITDVPSQMFLGDTWEWGAGPPNQPATATAYGSGCGIPALVLSPDSTGMPIVGTAAHALLASVPSAIALVAVGWSNTQFGPFPLPFPLDGYGMTGCKMWHSGEVLGLPVTFTGPTTATYTLAIPFWPSLVGARIYLQGYAVAPGMNPSAVIVSNGLDWLIGF